MTEKRRFSNEFEENPGMYLRDTTKIRIRDFSFRKTNEEVPDSGPIVVVELENGYGRVEVAVQQQELDDLIVMLQYMQTVPDYTVGYGV